MPPPAQFYSYNVITDEQRERLRAIRQPLHTFALDNPTLFNTWALNQTVNNISVHPHITQRHKGCDDSTPVRGASYEPVVLLGVSAEPRLSPDGSAKRFSIVLTPHDPRVVATVASFPLPKTLLPPACLPTYLPIYFYRARIPL